MVVGSGSVVMRGLSHNSCGAAGKSLSLGNREPNVEDHTGQQDDTNNPQQLSGTLQEGRVGIHRIGPRKNRKVTQEVPDHKEDKDDSRDRNNPLAADR